MLHAIRRADCERNDGLLYSLAQFNFNREPPVKSPTIRQLAQTEKPLVLPGAHDALSALLIKEAGFKGFFIGGFQTAGARYGLPDIGLCQLGEFSAAFRDMISACDLPVLVDADNGYGDVKNAVHLLHTYERMGVQAMFIEDQVSPKRCGHMAGKQVVPTEEMEAKLRAMAANRMNPDTFIVARTDARAIHGMDEALRRAERYVRAGADGVFIESMLNEDEIARAVREVQTCHVANMLEGGITPILKPSVLGPDGLRHRALRHHAVAARHEDHADGAGRSQKRRTETGRHRHAVRGIHEDRRRREVAQNRTGIRRKIVKAFCRRDTEDTEKYLYCDGNREMLLFSSVGSVSLWQMLFCFSGVCWSLDE